MENNNQDNYEESIQLWIEGQNKLIEIIELNITQLHDDINIKLSHIEILERSLKHERKFLNEYIDTL